MDRKQFLRSTLFLGGLGLASSALLVESCKKSSSTSSAQGPSANFTLDISQSPYTALKTVGG